MGSLSFALLLTRKLFESQSRPDPSKLFRVRPALYIDVYRARCTRAREHKGRRDTKNTAPYNYAASCEASFEASYEVSYEVSYEASYEGIYEVSCGASQLASWAVQTATSGAAEQARPSVA